MVANPISNMTTPKFRIVVTPAGDPDVDVEGVEVLVLGQLQLHIKLLE